jgi:hypothetical protein
MEKILSNIKSFQRFNEDITEQVYGEKETVEEPVKEEPKEPVQKKENAPAVAEEEETGGSLTNKLEKCIENVEEIVRLFEKDDTKLINLALPILDLCQTNLNFQEKKSLGANDLLTASKKIISEHVNKLKSEYPNNDPVTELIQNCGKL